MTIETVAGRILIVQTPNWQWKFGEHILCIYSEFNGSKVEKFFPMTSIKQLTVEEQ